MNEASVDTCRQVRATYHLADSTRTRFARKAPRLRVVIHLETETLTSKENLKHLMDLSGSWIDRAHRQLTKLILDMDSSVSETYGH